ncbi:MAG: Fur family transcriptional regulator [Tissierellia bacterium]|nr:Fur family transcriptional regulator [Tissierellia bacterium]
MKHLLREHQLKATKGRVAVMELLFHEKKPLSAEEIHERINDEMATSLSTIYRILAQLTEVGILRNSLSLGGADYYEWNGDPHHHHYIICESCGRVDPLHNCPLEHLNRHVQEETGYTITGHQFQLQGLCRDCQEKIAAENRKK